MVDSLIRLFESTATSFFTNGLGGLSDASKCEVIEERNGAFELEMEYHISGKRYSDLQLRRIIVAKSNPYSDPQPFRIYEISKPINGLVTVKAEHISYDMTGYPVSPFSASDVKAAISNAQTNSIVEHPFTLSTDMSASGEFTILKPVSMRSLLGGSSESILEVYGGEGEYEFNGYNVILHQNRGTNRGVTIRYGKNMTDLKQEENCSNVYTAVYPFWYSDEWGMIELPEKTLKTSGTFNYTRILPLDLSNDWENSYEWEDQYPTEDEVRELAQKYMSENNIGVPIVSLTVSFEQLSQTKEYETLALLETVRLCDEVNVEFPKLGVSATSKCIKTTYDAITNKYISIELGESQSSLSDTVSQQSQTIKEQPSQTFMEKAIQHATDLISGGLGGFVVIRSSSGGDYPDEILIMNDTNIEKATQVWRWNKGGLGYSDVGYNGPYRTAITQDGHIVADFVDTGHLTASIIQGGILTVGGTKLDKNGVNGTIEVRDSKNNLLIKLSVNGLEFFNGGGNPITSIVENTVTTEYVNALNVKAGSVDAENITGTTISGKTIVAGGDEDGIFEIRDSDNKLLIRMSVDGLEFFNGGTEPITSIIDDTVTANFINALKVVAGSVAAENITGTTISGKVFFGCTGEFEGTVNAKNLTALKCYYITDSDFGNKVKIISAPADDTSDTSYKFGRLTDNGYGAGKNYIAFKDESQDRQCHIYSGYLQVHGPIYTGSGCSFHAITKGDGIINDVGGWLARYADGSNHNNMVMLGNTDHPTSVYASGNIWKNGSNTSYLSTASTSSDKRLKEYVSDLSTFEKFFMDLFPICFKYHDGLYNSENTKPLIKWGFYAQDIISVFKKHEMNWEDYDLVVEEETDISSEERKYIDDTYDGILKVSYQNFTALNTYMIQMAYQKIEQQQKEIDELKEQLNEVLTYLKERK